MIYILATWLYCWGVVMMCVYSGTVYEMRGLTLNVPGTAVVAVLWPVTVPMLAILFVFGSGKRAPYAK